MQLEKKKLKKYFFTQQKYSDDEQKIKNVIYKVKK